MRESASFTAELNALADWLKACGGHRRDGIHAAAHKIARLIYLMLTKGQENTDQGQDYYEERYRERVLRALSQCAVKLGMRMVAIEQPL